MRLSLLLLAAALLTACGKEITTYDECVAAGHPALKSYPGQCTTPDGQRFVQQIPDPPSVCTDQCGNGSCEEVVCMGSGCPCAESPESCAKDCVQSP